MDFAAKRHNCQTITAKDHLEIQRLLQFETPPKTKVRYGNYIKIVSVFEKHEETSLRIRYRCSS